MNIEMALLDKKMSDIRYQRNEAQKAHVAQTFTNLSQASSNTAPKISEVSQDSTNMSKSIKSRDTGHVVQTNKASFDIISNGNKSDNTSVSSSASSAKSKQGRLFSRGKNTNGHIQDSNNSIYSGTSTNSAPKKTLLDNVKPLKPKRSISLLNIFKRKS